MQVAEHPLRSKALASCVFTKVVVLWFFAGFEVVIRWLGLLVESIVNGGREMIGVMLVPQPLECLLNLCRDSLLCFSLTPPTHAALPLFSPAFLPDFLEKKRKTMEKPQLGFGFSSFVLRLVLVLSVLVLPARSQDADVMGMLKKAINASSDLQWSDPDFCKWSYNNLCKDLTGNPVPPSLSTTFDQVNDLDLDPIILWVGFKSWWMTQIWTINGVLHLSDISELNLPKSCTIQFPNGKDDLMNFEVSIRPDDGYYLGGTFLFSFQVSPIYPHEAPKVKCKTKVYHPNIDLEGNVCLNILREDWKPVLSINTVIYGLYHLFTEPNYEDPLNHDAAVVLRENPKLFESNVRRAMAGGYVGQTFFPRCM